MSSQPCEAPSRADELKRRSKAAKRAAAGTKALRARREALAAAVDAQAAGAPAPGSQCDRAATASELIDRIRKCGAAQAAGEQE